MVTNIFLLINFQSISKQNHFFEKKRFHFKRDFSFLDIFKMSFFEKSPPDPKSTFFFQKFYENTLFYFISHVSGCEPFPAKVYIRIVVFLSS